MMYERGHSPPTPVISHAILSYNKGRTSGLADGLVVSPSHNPPEDGGFKYNPPHGGPADTDVTAKVEKAANAYMEAEMKGVARMPYERARKASSTHLHDYIHPYVADLGNAVDMALIKSSGVKIGIDPLGGAAAKLNRKLVETPVGFKWFVEGLGTGAFGFAGEESAGASFLKRDGSVWTTDKDGMVMGLLAAEILGRTGRDPSQLFATLTAELGVPYYERIDVPATPKQKSALKALGPDQLDMRQLAGEPVSAIRTRAPGNDQSFGGIKVESETGWFAARPSGTEDVYKIYAESFRDQNHLRTIQHDAQRAIAKVF